jgi:hypothetical protein
MESWLFLYIQHFTAVFTLNRLIGDSVEHCCCFITICLVGIAIAISLSSYCLAVPFVFRGFVWYFIYGDFCCFRKLDSTFVFCSYTACTMCCTVFCDDGVICLCAVCVNFFFFNVANPPGTVYASSFYVMPTTRMYSKLPGLALYLICLYCSCVA